MNTLEPRPYVYCHRCGYGYYRELHSECPKCHATSIHIYEVIPLRWAAMVVLVVALASVAVFSIGMP